MKKTYFIGAMLFATLLFACTSGDDKVAKTPEEPVVPEEPVTPEDPADPETPEDPVIVVTPSGFDWTTDRRVDLTLESPVRTRVSVYYDEACRESSLVGEEILLEAGVAEVIPAAVPSDTETLYVKYPAASGETAVVAIALNAAADDTAVADYKFPDDAVRTTYEKDGGFQFWHNSGVVMVEDMWPDFASSDADFNDLVMEYDLKVSECTDPSLRPSQGYKEGLFITLDIRGVGSGRTKKAGFQLLNFDTRFIESVSTHVYEKSGQGKMTELTDGRFRIEVDKSQPDRVLILFDGLDKLVQGKHYQTTQGEIITGKPMIRAYIKLAGNPNRSAMSGEAARAQAVAYREAIYQTKNHDFFMVLKPAYNSAEIHQKGFLPSMRYTTYDADSKGQMSGVPYCSVNNEVWVLKLPVGTRHAYDRTSLLVAYPDLREWIESNGERKKSWYKNYNSELVAPWW